jgi:hypothetical protein
MAQGAVEAGPEGLNWRSWALLKEVLNELFDLLFKVFFPVGFVVHHQDRDVSLLHMPDEGVPIVVKVDPFHLCPGNQVIVSTLSDGRFMPGDVSRPADVETDIHIDREAIIKDALVEILQCSHVTGTRELEKDHVVGLVDSERVRVDLLQNLVKDVI